MNLKNISNAIPLLLGLLNTLFLLANIQAAAAAKGIIAFVSAINSKLPNRGYLYGGLFDKCRKRRSRMTQKRLLWLIFIGIIVFSNIALLSNVWTQIPKKAQIAFTSSRDGNLEIYVMEADGRNVRNLTNHHSWDAWPTWSPDGQRIVFASRRNGRLADLYVMDANGKNTRQLTDFPGDVGEPAWSPDGQKIAFSASHVETVGIDIFVMNANGTDIRNLTNHPESDYAPDWSPDGQRIAFTSGRDGIVGIYVMDADRGNIHRLSDPDSLSSNHEPSWSPDGQRIVFRGGWEVNNWDIGIMGADGANPHRLTQRRLRDEDPSWSPDGKRIAFTGYRNNIGNNAEIYVIDVNGKNLRNLTNDLGWDGTPTWFDPTFERMVVPVENLFTTWGGLKRANQRK